MFALIMIRLRFFFFVVCSGYVCFFCYLLLYLYFMLYILDSFYFCFRFFFWFFFYFFFFKQKTAYEMRISDWSSDVCSSDLNGWAILLTWPVCAATSSSVTA